MIDFTFTAHVIPHTHWDRAWYLPFERFLAGLPALFDSIFAFLAIPENPPFLLDGQTIILDDYLELRPFDEEKLRELVSSGRLSAGPFYAQTDMLLSHPEAIIRNLLLGDKSSRGFGRKTLVAYFPDTWGIPRQIPQILADFGIKAVILGRGYKEDVRETGTEFRYAGLDGTELPFVFMPKGYINGINLGYAGKWGDPSAQPFSMDRAVSDIQRACEELKPITLSKHLLVMNGGDHEKAEPRLAEILGEARKRQGISFDTGGVDSFGEALAKASDALPRYDGDILHGRYSYMVHGILSTRAYLKLRQARLSVRLVNAIEPLVSFLRMTGNMIEPSILERAWKLILQNLIHDEIGGCGLDSVHREMMLRYDKIEQILDFVQDECALILAENTPADLSLGKPFLIFNPSCAPLNGAMSASFTIDPRSLDPEEMMLNDEKGRSLPFQILKTSGSYTMRINEARSRSLVEAAFDAGTIDPFSFKLLYLRGGKGAAAGPASAPVPRESGRISNGILEVEFSKGSLTLRDTRTRLVYRDFLRLVDEADAGDEYTYCPLACDHPRVLPFDECRLSVLHEGPLYSAMRIEARAVLPLRIDRERGVRSDDASEFAYSFELGLFSGRPDLRVSVRTVNASMDHRLRLKISADCLSFASHRAGVHFGERESANAGDRFDDSSWRESYTKTRYFVRYLSFGDDSGGLVIASDDSREYEFTEESAVDFTLFRGVGDLSREDLSTRKGGAGFSFATPDAQCLGAMEFRFGIRLLKGEEGHGGAQVYTAAQALLSDPLCFDCTDVRGALPGEFNHPDMPDTLPLLTKKTASPEKAPRALFSLLPGNCVICAFKPLEDGRGCAVRILNLSPERERALLRIDESLVSRISASRLDESSADDIPVRDGMAEVEIRGFGMITLRMESRM
jgi:mannosylglycerate hydrolase